MKLRMQDEQMWLMGQYTLSAVSVAVEHCLAGRKAKSEYIKEPILLKSLEMCEYFRMQSPPNKPVQKWAYVVGLENN